MRNIALKLRYDGSAYHGWQVQKYDVSVAETVEKALSKVCGHPVKVTGCGRTDAGVHALNYCANFRTDSRIPVERIPLAVNTRLPDDIAVLGAVEAPEDFNAILSCIKKEYVYRIMNTRIRDPFLQKRVCWRRRRPSRGRTTSLPCAASAPRQRRRCGQYTGAGQRSSATR